MSGSKGTARPGPPLALGGAASLRRRRAGRQIKLGDNTMSVLEIWGAEYQENDCLLIKPRDRGVLEGICARERCSMQVGPALPLIIPPPPPPPSKNAHTQRAAIQLTCDTPRLCTVGVMEKLQRHFRPG